jgi:hypothetical protein
MEDEIISVVIPPTVIRSKANGDFVVTDVDAIRRFLGLQPERCTRYSPHVIFWNEIYAMLYELHCAGTIKVLNRPFKGS